MQTCPLGGIVLNHEENSKNPQDSYVNVCIDLSKTGPETVVLIQGSGVPDGHLELTKVTITQNQASNMIVVEGGQINLPHALTRLYARASKNDGREGVRISEDKATQTEDDVVQKKTDESASGSFWWGVLMRFFYSCTAC